MAKSPDAFRTISEVSEWLDTPAHVLRFWESKFTQVKPVKRAGGRRYYRPEDMALLGGIKMLLHEEGMTIKGVQKLLREKGVKHVQALGPDPAEEAEPEGSVVSFPAPKPRPAEETQPAEPEPAPPPAEPVTPALWPADDPWPADPVFTPEPAPAPAAAEAPRPAPEPQPELDISAPAPAAPAEPPRPESGVISLLQRAEGKRLRAGAPKIAPLLARMRDLRERMAREAG